jgi:hypothetical protein
MDRSKHEGDFFFWLIGWLGGGAFREGNRPLGSVLVTYLLVSKLQTQLIRCQSGEAICTHDKGLVAYSGRPPPPTEDGVASRCRQSLDFALPVRTQHVRTCNTWEPLTRLVARPDRSFLAEHCAS